MATAGPHSASQDLELLRTAAVHAGIIALGFFRSDLKTWLKNQTSPVTEADMAVDRFLTQALRTARPDYGWLSEETADTEERLDRQRVFIVDPIDGTRGFIKGEDSWTICLAVVEAGATIAAVVYAPARDEMYAAVRGHGATLNGQKLQRFARPDAGPVIPAPGAVHHLLNEAGLDYVRGPAYPSLAYRLVQVATGHLDAAVARRGAQDWDIAAADLILSESGITLEDVCVGRPVYNRTQTRHAALAATSDGSLRSLLVGALRSVYGCPDPVEHETILEHRHS
jgi:myo-inositol-1(or 4)-monophosphatase